MSATRAEPAIHRTLFNRWLICELEIGPSMV